MTDKTLFIKNHNTKYPRSMSSYNGFKVFMYSNELEFLKWLVLQKSNIETGGDLFGLWQSDETAIVQLIFGPGKNCSRTTTSFHPDVQYLGDVGRYLTSCEGICNIGEWHSHHRIGFTSPSGGDQNTIRNHLPSMSGVRFLLYCKYWGFYTCDVSESWLFFVQQQNQ